MLIHGAWRLFSVCVTFDFMVRICVHKHFNVFRGGRQWHQQFQFWQWLRYRQRRKDYLSPSHAGVLTSFPDISKDSYCKHHMLSCFFYSFLLYEWLPRWSSGKASTLRMAALGTMPAFPLGAFSRSSHTSDLKTGTPIATLPGAWHHRVSAGTGWPLSVCCDLVR